MDSLENAVEQEQIADSILEAPIVGDGQVHFADEEAPAHDPQTWQDPGQEILDEFAQERQQPDERQDQSQTEAQPEESSQALANYEKLAPAQQEQLCIESVRLGLEQVAPLINPEQAKILNDELFSGQADAVPTATALAFMGRNALETLENAGLERLTLEQAQQLTDPHMANITAALWEQMAKMQVVDPMYFASGMLFHAPALLNGWPVTQEWKQGFAAFLCAAHGQAQQGRDLPAAEAAAMYDRFAKWGKNLGSELRRIKGEQAQAQPRQGRQAARPSRSAGSRQKSGSSKFRTNQDIFGDDAMEAYRLRHGAL
jgi:hypothetical protein